MVLVMEQTNNKDSKRLSIMEKDKLQSIAFEVITLASEAMDFCFKSLNAAKDGNMQKSESLMAQYDEVISKAHKAQMSLITSEAKGIEMPYSIIMVHAQDHLMQAIFIQRVVKELIEVHEILREMKNAK